MQKPDENTILHKAVPLQTDPDDSSTQFGTALISYAIRQHVDVRNLKSVMAYQVSMRQRIIIPNTPQYAPGPNSQTSFDDYPAAIQTTTTLTTNNGASLELINMFPKTLNSSVTTATNDQSSESTGTSYQHTSGSSTTNSNTYGVSVSAGYQGGAMGGPSISGTVDYQHSQSHTHEHSDTSGTSSDSQTAISHDDSMSIKDWSSYGALDDDCVTPTWVWAQTYPWDVLLYNYSTSGTTIRLPDFVESRLTGTDSEGNKFALPPSELSLFGVDFTMTAGWLIEYPDGITETETIDVTHDITLYQAKHSITSEQIVATLEDEASASSCSIDINSIDLSTYALTPISASRPSAAIGFTSNPFTFAPASADDPFKIVSPMNNLQVTGSGFDNVMTTTFSEDVSLNVQFKIADRTTEYSLLIMSWIDDDSERVRLTFTINGRPDITADVTSTEGQGGQNNITEVELRNTDITSINFHDYLILGTNEIDIKIEPVSTDTASTYTLFALAIAQP